MERSVAWALVTVSFCKSGGWPLFRLIRFLARSTASAKKMHFAKHFLAVLLAQFEALPYLCGVLFNYDTNTIQQTMLQISEIDFS